MSAVYIGEAMRAETSNMKTNIHLITKIYLLAVNRGSPAMVCFPDNK